MALVLISVFREIINIMGHIKDHWNDEEKWKCRYE